MDRAPWNLELQDLGGMGLLGERVRATQRRGEDGDYVHLRRAAASAVVIRFHRAGYQVHLDMRTRGSSLLYLENAVMTGRRDLPIRVSLESGGRIETSFGKNLRHVVGVAADGAINMVGMQLPPSGMPNAPEAIKRSYCRTANSLAAWSLVLLRAFCRCCDDGLQEVLEIHDDLVIEAHGLYHDLALQLPRLRGSEPTRMRFPGLELF